MYMFNIKRLSDGDITHRQLSDDINYSPIGLDDIDYEYEIVIEPYPEYIDLRRPEYGAIEDQLDEIFHDFEAWKARIQSIKDKYPK